AHQCSSTPLLLSSIEPQNGSSISVIIYHELVLTTKEYCRDVTAIEPKWLTEVAPTFFKVADAKTMSKRKRNERVQPLFDRFAKVINYHPFILLYHMHLTLLLALSSSSSPAERKRLAYLKGQAQHPYQSNVWLILLSPRQKHHKAGGDTTMCGRYDWLTLG
ncbi:adenosinetriphosphatase, partial [Puccinia sorghi]